MSNFPRDTRCSARRAGVPAALGAFTLVEVLVSMGVLVIMIVWITQLTNSTGSTISQSQKYVDADSQARLIFSRMTADFANMLQRTDVDFSTFKHPAYSVPANAPMAAGLSFGDNLQTGAAGGGNDQFAFYAEGPGYYIGANGNNAGFAANARAPVSLVAYNIQADVTRGNSTNLQRMSKALGWDANPGQWQRIAYLPVLLKDQWLNPKLFVDDPTQPAGIDPAYTTVGDQVFRLEYNYLIKANPAANLARSKVAHLSTTPWDDDTANIPAHNLTTNGLNDVAAIVVAIAVLDPRSRVIVSPASMTAMSAALPDAVASTDTNPNPDILASWTDAVNGANGYPNFATRANIPPSAAAAVRVYQRYFYLDGH